MSASAGGRMSRRDVKSSPKMDVPRVPRGELVRNLHVLREKGSLDVCDVVENVAPGCYRRSEAVSKDSTAELVGQGNVDGEKQQARWELVGEIRGRDGHAGGIRENGPVGWKGEQVAKDGDGVELEVLEASR